MFSLKVKQNRHDICHQGELRISDDDLKNFLDNFKAVLNHTALQNDDIAKAALTALHKVCILIYPIYLNQLAAMTIKSQYKKLQSMLYGKPTAI